MVFNIIKYIKNIAEEYKTVDKYKKILFHCVIAGITLILFLFIIALIYIFVYSNCNTDRFKTFMSDIGYVQGFIVVNIDSLKDYCSVTDYVPNLYIYKFSNRFKNTIEYADSELSAVLDDKEITQLKEFARSKGIEELDNNYEKDKKVSTNLTRIRYCQLYDEKADEYINNKINIFKSEKPNLFKD